MMLKLNACDPDNLAAILARIIALAAEDHRNNRREGTRTGEALAQIFCSDSRKGHRMLFTAVYNRARWTMRLHNEEKSKGEG